MPLDLIVDIKRHADNIVFNLMPHSYYCLIQTRRPLISYTNPLTLHRPAYVTYSHLKIFYFFGQYSFYDITTKPTVAFCKTSLPVLPVPARSHKISIREIGGNRSKPLYDFPQFVFNKKLE